MGKMRLSLKTQLIGILIITSLIPIMILGSTLIRTEYKKSQDSFMNPAYSTIKSVDREIESLISGYSEYVNMLSSDPNIKRNLENGDFKNNSMTVIKNMKEVSKNATSVYFGNENGETFLHPNNGLASDYDPRKRDWYKNAKDQNDIVITPPYLDSFTSTDIITISKKVVDNSGKLIGVAAIDVQLKSLGELVSKSKIGEKGIIIVAYNNENIIASNNKDFLSKEISKESYGNSLKSAGDNGKVSLNNETYMVKKIVNPNGYTSYGLVNESEVASLAIKNLMVPIIMVIVFLILAILVSVIYTGKLIKVARKIIGVLNNCRNKDFVNKIDTSSIAIKELFEISESTNLMIDNMITVLSSANNVSGKLKEESKNVSGAVSEFDKGSKNIAEAMLQLSQGTIEQANSIEDGVNLSVDLGEMISKTLEYSNEVTHNSHEVQASAKQGMEVVDKLNHIQSDNHESIESVVKQSKVLEENSKKITNIINTMKSITEQTNILALNASIEAARAGEAGRGFAVVANEVKNLSEMSTDAASKIDEIIDENIKDINTMIVEINKSKDIINITSESVKKTYEEFDDISKKVETLNDFIEKSNENLMKIEEVKELFIDKLQAVSAVAEESAASTEEVEASTSIQLEGVNELNTSCNNLEVLSNEIYDIIKEFKTDRE